MLLKPYVIIVDSNVLFQSANSGGDLRCYKFNKSFFNIYDLIKDSRLQDYISIIIPDIVWEEIKQQIFECYNQIISDASKYLQYNIPGLAVSVEHFDYRSYMEEMMSEVKERSIEQDIAQFDIPLPYFGFRRIIERALKKEPPFLGKGKESDKGFKDAVLWESILQFKEKHLQRKLYFYSKDNGFSQQLQIEYRELFSDEISIFHDLDGCTKAVKDIATMLNSDPSIIKKLDNDIALFKRIEYDVCCTDIIKIQYIKHIDVDNAWGDNAFVSAISSIKLINITDPNSGQLSHIYDLTAKVNSVLLIKDETDCLREFSPFLHIEVSMDKTTEQFEYKLVGVTTI